VTHEHIRRVQHNAVRLARALRVDDEMEIQAIKAAALLHDVGKLGIPEHILNKPGRLSASEFEIMKRHAPLGADILSMIGFPYPVVPIVRHHHESWDGSGYPDGIAGEKIPIGARILAVVDCFDALISDRPYRPRLADQEALKILADRKGTMYDPRVVDTFFELHASQTGHMRVDDTLVAEPEPAAPAAPAPPALPQPPQPQSDVSFADAHLDVGFELGRAVPRDASLSRLGDALWNDLRNRVAASAFVLFVYDDGSDSLAPACTAGDATVAPDVRIPLGERLSGWVAAAQQEIFNSDARLDLDTDVRDSTQLRYALAVPVSAAGKVLGVLTFYTRQQEGFSDIHLRIVQTAARVAAIHLKDRAPASASQPAA
jgi:putative nucleotidyltransferase with HDIG domain